jgi:hypothetical protein
LGADGPSPPALPRVRARRSGALTVLYQQLSPAERSRLLAAHYVRALPTAAAEVVHYVPIAAEHANARGAYDKAAELYDHATRASDR